MRIGKLAELQCVAGWNRLYTVPRGENGIVSIALASLDGSEVIFQVRHVKAGNEGSIQHSAVNTINTPYVLSNEVSTIVNLGVDSLDDIWVSANVGMILIASVNSQGIEYRKQGG
jgi:hypothetical protein